MRTDVVRRLGAFNTSFAQGGEDTELFTRARAAGHALWFTPRVLKGVFPLRCTF